MPLAIGQYVTINEGGPSWSGQVVDRLGSGRYVVRIGGTDSLTVVEVVSEDPDGKHARIRVVGDGGTPSAERDLDTIEINGKAVIAKGAGTLERFVGSYETWQCKPAGMSKRAQKFYRDITLHGEPAIAYLATLLPGADSHAQQQIYRLGGMLAFAGYVPDFKMAVAWFRADDDVLQLGFATLVSLVGAMRQGLTSVRGKGNENTVRFLYALLLTYLLPIYFVKAANIRDMIDFMDGRLTIEGDAFIVAVCPRGKDYSPLKTAPQGSGDTDLDCLRGFQPKRRRRDGKWCLILTYNPEADVGPALHGVQARRIAADFLD